LETALDSVNYDFLLSKLEYYGIKGTDKTLYKPYTCITDIREYHHMKRIHTNFPFSNWANVKCGTLQDSIQLLLIHIDLPKAINRCIPILVADGTNIFFSHYDPDDSVENIHPVFEALNNWLKNLLSLNLEIHITYTF